MSHAIPDHKSLAALGSAFGVSKRDDDISFEDVTVSDSGPVTSFRKLTKTPTRILLVGVYIL
ncbi:MAG: hypothetical protein DI525_01970 [Corynebacterium kroppenstedtii]|uniref:Uncharacterized protein n=1 Tax=Corynebacterium kroppenstedtii TaxID=161879 RepID=A0A2W5T2B5_9CORY|nr:MAG: hypothetical protein DI525_01970 [Corynebacterium kroppenstedtii]